MLQTVALTGGTGFVGAAILSTLTAAGHPVRALARVDRPDLPGITWIRGDLRTSDSLRALTDGADVVIHCAGAIKALDAQGFLEVNALGTKRLLDACAGRALRFVHISSLAARAPSLSAYAGSKAAAERAVMESGLDWLILRPGAVYGPGDRATLSLFQAVKWGVAPVFSEARAAVVHVADVASAVLAGLTQGRGIVADLHDGAPGGGYTQLEIFRMIGAALGKTPRVLHIPRSLAERVATIAEQIAGWRSAPGILTRGKVAELYHDGWASTDTTLADATGWAAQIPAARGLADTAAWYLAHKWL